VGTAPASKMAVIYQMPPDLPRLSDFGLTKGVLELVKIYSHRILLSSSILADRK